MLDNLELPDNDRPIYQRLADAIGERIARGELSAANDCRRIAKSRGRSAQRDDRHARVFALCNSAASSRRGRGAAR